MKTQKNSKLDPLSTRLAHFRVNKNFSVKLDFLELNQNFFVRFVMRCKVQKKMMDRFRQKLLAKVHKEN